MSYEPRTLRFSHKVLLLNKDFYILYQSMPLYWHTLYLPYILDQEEVELKQILILVLKFAGANELS